MSCYNWESGDIKIPASEWASLKKRIRDSYNSKQGIKFEEAMKHYNKILEAAKGKRGFDKAAWYEKFCWDVSVKYNFLYELFPYQDGSRRKNPIKPKKNMFPGAKTTDTLLRDSDCEIEFINKTRTVIWTVFENNKAVEHARASTIGKALFSALRYMKWTSKTGGLIIGNDEYNRSSEYAGGGGNYISESYGGIGKRATKSYIKYGF